MLICAVIISMTMITNISDNSSQKNSFVQTQFTSSNAASGAQIVFETLKKDKKADAANMLDDSNKCWTAQCPDGSPAETFDCLDQVQFMAYDGNDEDGYQSSLQQAEEGLRDFEKNGADISKINIGIAVYDRPISGAPYWASWRTLENVNCWDSKYYNVPDAGQIYDGTFCSPALAGDKTAYALLSGAGGVMVFRVGCDRLIDDQNSVTGGIEDTLNRYVTGW